MSIVSGLATAPGISALLNAPRESASPLRVLRSDPAATIMAAREETARRPSTSVQTVRAVAGPNRADATPPPQIRRESSDPRYLQFVDAVTALRIDLSEETLTRSRVAELRDAAKAVFRMEGVPEDREPDIVQANASDNRERVARQQERAERRRVEADEAAADRREAAKRALAETVESTPVRDDAKAVQKEPVATQATGPETKPPATRPRNPEPAAQRPPAAAEPAGTQPRTAPPPKAAEVAVASPPDTGSPPAQADAASTPVETSAPSEAPETV